jgi:hypothetical protein
MAKKAGKKPSPRLHLSDAARKLGSKFCDQLLEDKVTYSDALDIMRAVLVRQAVIGNAFVRKTAAEVLHVDRKHLIETYKSTSQQLFPEDIEAEISRYRAKRKRE